MRCPIETITRFSITSGSSPVACETTTGVRFDANFDRDTLAMNLEEWVFAHYPAYDYIFENDGSYYFVIEGLNSSSTYTVNLRSDCTEDLKGTSKWSEDFTFRTLCESVELPYIENFDAEDRLVPFCWSVNPDNFSGVEISTSGFKYGDSGYSLILKGNASKSTFVVSGQIAHAANNLEVSMMVYGDYGLPFNVGLTTDPLSGDAFEILWEDTIDFHTGWHEVRFCTDATYYGNQEDLSLFISLPAGVSGSNRLYVDAFVVKERPTCPRLEKVELKDILAQTEISAAYYDGENWISTQLKRYHPPPR